MTDIHRLTAILTGRNRSDDLRHHVAGDLEALGRFDHLAVHYRAVIQHIPNIDQAAIENRLNKIVHIMEMQHTIFMRFGDFCRQNQTPGQIFGNFSGNQIPLRGSHDRILIAVFFHHIFIAVADQRKDGLVRRIGFTY